MANLMNKTKAQLIEHINEVECEKTALELERNVLQKDVEVETKAKESLKVRVNELNSLIEVKNNGLKEQAEMIVKLNNELDIYKNSLFKVTNELDDCKCKLTIAKAKTDSEKSLHKYYAIGGVLTGIAVYVLLTLLF